MMKYISAVVITVAIVGGVTYYSVNQKKIADEKILNTQINILQSQVDALSTTKTADLTNDQIFQEASTQLGLQRNNLLYFRIFGQDRIQYSVGTTPVGSGTTFAYKANETWKIAGPDGSQALFSCSLLAGVPEKFRPLCDTEITSLYPKSLTAYMTSDHKSVNYPPSQMVSYIGQ